MFKRGVYEMSIENKFFVRDFSADSYVKYISMLSINKRMIENHYTTEQRNLCSRIMDVLGKPKHNVVFEVVTENATDIEGIIFDIAKIFVICKDVSKIVYVCEDNDNLPFDVEKYCENWINRECVTLYQPDEQYNREMKPCFVIVDNVNNYDMCLDLFDIYGYQSVYVFINTVTFCNNTK